MIRPPCITELKPSADVHGCLVSMHKQKLQLGRLYFSPICFPFFPPAVFFVGKRKRRPNNLCSNSLYNKYPLVSGDVMINHSRPTPTAALVAANRKYCY